ncbi:MAG TPA: hydrogenase nickel incorporation protein HypB [Candidatus Gemmiger avicola]|uniref:Hydrogenase nickel incorporation protein HypB n=1 Tax=Candidatus Gemmiger avicola TaxID=2838605 RepID=A0A9D2M8M6_9FIRM|nr:hydrogenase nickel incorporation protein HypB [Candidatus Gemmiger avicola]
MEIKVLHQVMEWNEDVSAAVRETLRAHKVCLVNVMGSPGAGKTSLITEMIRRLRGSFSIGVIEGDITGQIDAEKIAALQIPAVQLNTDGACHIEAMSIQHILPQFDLDATDLLFVENIGNLVCPAEFDIGENFRLTVLSIPEGDDKVAKYPLMFTDTDCLALTKCDMLPYFDFDLNRVAADYRGVNPQGPLFRLSTRSGEGLDALSEHLAGRVRAALA